MFNGWFVITCISNYEVPHKCLITFFVKLCHWSNLLCLYCEKYRIAFGSKFCFVNWTVVTEAKLIWNFPVVLGLGGVLYIRDRYSLNSDNGCLVLMIDCQVKTTARDWWSGLLLYCIILESKPFKNLF